MWLSVLPSRLILFLPLPPLSLGLSTVSPRLAGLLWFCGGRDFTPAIASLECAFPFSPFSNDWLPSQWVFSLWVSAEEYFPRDACLPELSLTFQDWAGSLYF